MEGFIIYELQQELIFYLNPVESYHLRHEPQAKFLNSSLKRNEKDEWSEKTIQW